MTYDVRAWDRVLQGFSPCFDASMEEIWVALSAGAALVVGGRHTMQITDEFPEVLHRHGVTVSLTVPSLLAVMPPTTLPGLRLLIVGGEACGAAVVKKWSATGRRFLNTLLKS